MEIPPAAWISMLPLFFDGCVFVDCAVLMKPDALARAKRAALANVSGYIRSRWLQVFLIALRTWLELAAPGRRLKVAATAIPVALDCTRYNGVVIPE